MDPADRSDARDGPAPSSFDPARPVPLLIADRARETPDAPVCVQGSRQVSYCELLAQADAVAARLAALGIGRDDRVALSVPRSPEMLAGLLGILRAGAAYVPLDPTYPASRQTFMLEDSGARALVAGSTLPPGVPWGLPVLRVDEPVTGEAFPDLPAPGPADLAYVIYTSGSTGRPKGVMMEHRGLLNRLHWMRERFRVGPGSRVLQKTPLSFDPSVWECLLAPAFGGTVVLAGAQDHRDPDALVSTIREQRPTLAFFVPAQLALFLETDGAQECRSLRDVLVGGEAVPPALVRRFLERLPAPLHNDYGPTETAMAVTCHTFRRGDTVESVPIGTANTGCTAHVVDDALRPVADGEVGELVIGGAQVARGYLGRPDLTAQRFLPDPWGGPGDRVYRTGDLARRTPGGVLEYVGRSDLQVKVRGFRVEPGEVEHCLAEHPSVGQAVVVARDDPAGGKRLVAFVTGADADEGVLRSHAAAQLPEHMVPARIVVLDVFPLTPAGKVDRESLVEPMGAATAPAEPRDDAVPGTARRVAEIWADVLGVASVAPGDDFLALGGHSLSAARVIARCREAFGVAPAFRTLFELRTLERFTAAVDEAVRVGPVTEEALAPTSSQGPVPLTPGQMAVWLECRMDPGRPDYNQPVAVRIHGPLDVDMLRFALSAVVDRHAPLRTRFVEEPQGPVQVVVRDAHVELPLAAPGELTHDELAAFLAEEARRPFDLEAGPPMRALLVRQDLEDHVLLVTLHHLVMDEWSVSVLLDEISAHYRTGVLGTPVVLPPLSVTYADVARWSVARLGGDTGRVQREHWARELAGADFDLALPRDAAPGASAVGIEVELSVPPALGPAVLDLAARRGVTPFVVNLTAFIALLHRYTGQDEVVVGTPVAERTRPEIGRLVGYLLNTVAVRADLSSDPTFADLLAAVNETMLGAHAHPDLPLHEALAAARPGRSGARGSPLCAVFVQVVDPAETLQLPDAVCEPVHVPMHTAKFDLTLYVTQRRGALSARVEVRSDRLRAETAARLGAHWLLLLAGAAADPDRPVSALPLASAAERRRVIEEFNRTARPYPRDLPVHAVFDLRAQETSDAPALLHRGAVMTYGELRDGSLRLARRLVDLGVKPGDRVPVCLERSFDLVTAFLAVLRTGAAYVPLDPSYPAPRIALMLADAASRVVVTEAALLDRVAAKGTACVVVDRERDALEAISPVPVDVAVDGSAAAYVMYTSGSTGRPKGVVARHRGIVRLVVGADYAEFGPEHVWLQMAPVSFDASTLEIWAPLLHGGRCALASERTPSVPALRLALRRNRVTSLWLTSSLYDAVIDEDPDCLRGLKQLLVGGEALSPVHVARGLALLPDTTMVNGYGPTENTTFTCCHRIPRDTDGSRPVPIGRPISNTRVYVIEDGGEPAPIGVPGELYAGGDGVAAGYLGLPETTAERFVPDPYSADPDARLYRTGDRVRWTDDGTLEFLGRLDHQVKVRGHRIEPGEVEAALLAHPAIAKCAVIARDAGASGTQLVAYTVAHDPSGAPSADALRTHLAGTLPDPMIPQAFVALDELPVTANGKLDREALPAPRSRDLDDAIVDPRSDTERELARIFRSLLGVERIGVHDDFFRLGGHSLLAVKAFSEIEKALGVALAVRTIFTAPTIARLARVVDVDVPGDAPAPIARIARNGPVPASFGQVSLWIEHQLDPASPVYNTPLCMRLRGDLHPPKLRAALDALVERHEALRTRFRAGTDGPVQIVEPGVHVELHEGRLADPSPEKVEEALRREAARIFDLRRAPLLRALLLRVREDEQMLLVTFHHIVIDDWSIDVFLRELGELYTALCEDRAPRLPDLPVQYPDVAVWMRERMRGGGREEELGWWTGGLEGARFEVELPRDRAPDMEGHAAGEEVPFDLDPALAGPLKEVSARAGVTPFITCFAAFFALLQRTTGQDDLVVGTPIAGRARPELGNLIGYFLNTLAIRADLSGDPAFRELLAQVRTTFLGAHAHPSLPLDQLLAELSPERGRGRRSPLQVMFVHLSDPTQTLKIPGVVSEHVPLSTGAAKFDLTLFVIETPRGLEGRIEYRTGLFDRRTVERLGRRYGLLLAAAVAAPDTPISRLPVLDPEEHALLTGGWNATATDYPRDATVHQLFAEQACATPDAVALVAGEETVSYAELDARANRLAQHLRMAGLPDGALVPVCVERGPELIVALLAVLKAGCAYVPLDPGYPVERLALMMQDCAPAVVLTEEGLRDELPIGPWERVLVDRERSTIAARPATAPESAAPATGIAYVMYTSGSTGEPKGVLVPHRGIVRLVRATDFARMGPQESWLQLAPVSFDASTLEIWAPLLNGGRLVLFPERLPSLEGLRAAVRDHGVTSLWLTASLFDTVVDHDPQILAGVGQLLVGGEALSPQHVARALAALPATTIVNGYGPTENTTFTCCHTIPRDAPPTRAIPIGRPIANTRVYVLDPQGGLAPVGVPGELYAGGDGVAAGYLGRPALTDERFVPDPFCADPDARLYRTGDRVRWLPDGTLDFLGRMDRQVKIRGFRIEPGEIEAVLADHPSVQRAVADVRDAGESGRRLVAYFVQREGRPAPPPEELVSFLAERLPEHMVPSVVIPIDEVPLNRNGKLDRDRLPEPPPPGSAPAGAAPARNALERRMVEVWKDLLGLEEVGVHDDFFAIGGHSLLAVKMFARLEAELGSTIPVRAIFSTPTIAGLASLAEAPEGPVEQAILPPTVVELHTGGDAPPLFCIPGVGGHVFMYRELSGMIGARRPVFGLQIQDLEETATGSVEDMARALVNAVRLVQPVGPYHVAGYSFGGLLAYEMARQLEAEGEVVRFLGVFDAFAPGAVRSAPLLTKIGLHVREVLRRDPAGMARYLGVRIRKRVLPYWLRLTRLLGSASAESPSLGRRVATIRIACMRAARSYTAGPYGGPMWLFRASRMTDWVRADETDRTNGWGERVAGGVTTLDIECEHLELFRDPYLGRLADHLRRELDGLEEES